MGSLGDVEDSNGSNLRKTDLDVDLKHEATLQVDSQYSPVYMLGGDFRCDGADDFHYLTNTIPIDDTFLLEDAFDTQLVDLAGETQLLDLAGETQLMDLPGETQLMDLPGETQLMDLPGEIQLTDLAGETQLMDFVGETQVLDDLDSVKNVPSKLLNEHVEVTDVSDNEGTNKTEVLCDTQQLSQDDSMKSDGGNSVTQVNMEDTYPYKQGDIVSGAPSDTLSTEEHPSGSVCRGFTSIRTASIRASGLAACAKGASGNLCSISSEKSFLKQRMFEQGDTSLVVDLLKSGRNNNKECLWNGYNEDNEKLRNPNKCKAVPVRKLFTEDRVAKVGQTEADMNHTDDNLNKSELLASENCLAGLSYVNSQEPGEASQANALEVVDRFLELNVMEYDQGLDYRVPIAKKPEVVSGAKGSRDLAKSFILKNTDGECQAYDWDDNREDEGGGDFFLKKKELFFDKRSPKERSFTEPRKSRGPDLRSIKTVGDHGVGKEQTYTKKKLGLSTYSDSGLMLQKFRAKGKSLHCGDEAFCKNLTKDLDERSDMAPGHKLADNDTSNDIPDMKGIGHDTQMAVEAMETLCFEVHLANSKSNEPDEGVCNMTKSTRKNQSSDRAAHLEQSLIQKMPCPSVLVVTRQAKHARRTSSNTINKSSLSSVKQTRNFRKRCDAEQGEVEQRSLADVNDDGVSYGKGCPRTLPLKMKEQKERRAGIRSSSHEIEPYHGTELTGQKSEKKRCVVEQLDLSIPVAHGTRKGTKLKCSKAAGNSVDAREEINDLISTRVLRKRRTAANDNNAEMGTIETFKKMRSTGVKQSNTKCVGTSSASNLDALKHLERKRTRQKTLLDEQEAETKCNARLNKSRIAAASTSLDPGRNHANHSSTSNCPMLSSLDWQSEKIQSQQTVDNEISRNNVHSGSDHGNVKANLNDAVEAGTPMQCDGKSDTKTLKSAEGPETIGRLDASPGERCGTSFLTSTTPATCATPINNASPICMGDEYPRQSCRKKLSRVSLMKEINSLITDSSLPFGGMKDLRKRKDTSNISVLFSQHLDVDVIKQQKKILSKLGAAAASSMLDATHFVADEFVRTRNMLEAIAFGKPVVTHLWLESCGQASCFVNEKNYILRDARKEKEFGFCMSVSLSRACQHPLLQGQKVLVTPNTKPGKDIIINLVKAVHGLAVERLGRSVLKDEKLPDDLLILSCEEDYDVCVPFLEKGGSVYSSELLLNGIVKQKLEFERHRLFEDHVKRTRSTIWVKKNRVTKCK